MTSVYFCLSPTSISSLDAKQQQSQKLIAKTCVQKVQFQDKNATSWIQNNNFLFASQVLYHLNTVSCGFQSKYFSSFLYTFAFNSL